MSKVHEKITCEVYLSTGPLAPHKIVIIIVNYNYKLCERIVYRHGAILLIVREGAVVLTLGGDDMEACVPDRGQKDFEREKVEVRDKERETKRGPTTHAQTCNMMDGMWME